VNTGQTPTSEASNPFGPDKMTQVSVHLHITYFVFIYVMIIMIIVFTIMIIVFTTIIMVLMIILVQLTN